MPAINRGHLSDLRGAVDLAVSATIGITDLVEEMHHAIQLKHPPLGASRAGATRGLTGFVYRSIRATTRLVGRGLDAGLSPVAALLPEDSPAPSRDAIVSALNGVVGDHLSKNGNPLTMRMSLRYRGQPFDSENPVNLFDGAENTALTGKVMLLVHGLCLNDRHWTQNGRDLAQELATNLGYTPVYLRYNTGLSIAANGYSFADMLESLLKNWPVPVETLAIIGHSMGGLLARSAVQQGRLAGHCWPNQLDALVFLGTPHHGAPLERGGAWLEKAMGLSPYVVPFSRIGKSRSAGINDLHHGSVTDTAQEFVPLPDGVECYAVAASLATQAEVMRNRARDRLLGDGLVPIDSALGRSADQSRMLAFPENRQWTGYEMGHLELLGHPGVYAQLRDWLQN